MSAPVDRVSRSTCSTAAAILVVEADNGASGGLESRLHDAGHRVVTATADCHTPSLLARNHIDLVLADVDATAGGGMELLDMVRLHDPSIAVILVARHDEIERKVAALRAGADDYIIRPFHPAELLARAEAVLRRSQRGLPRELSYGGLRVDLDRLIVTRDGREVTLTPTELRLAILLLENAEHVVSKGQILDQVWQYDFQGESLIVEKVVSNLRKKVDNGDRPLIQTVRGFGYTLRRAADRG